MSHIIVVEISECYLLNDAKTTKQISMKIATRLIQNPH